MPVLRLSRRIVLALATLAPVLRPGPALAAAAPAAGVDQAGIDAIAETFMRRFDIPGLAIGVTVGGARHARGYGVRRLGQAEPVDAHTLFAIGSNTKAFTAAAIAQLVDDGKLAWDTPVRTYLPEFRMSDPVATEAMTVRDLLVHHSGLSLGAGDLLFFPASTHKAADVLDALPHLRLERGFRSGYAYDNILYIVAGLLIERVSGASWREVVTTRLLRPLGMADSVASGGMIQSDNVAGRHARLGPPVRGMGPMRAVQPDEIPMIDAAGGLNASVADCLLWLDAQLAHGALPGGGRLWREDSAAAMWTPQTIVAATNGPTADDPARAVTSTYALGWFVEDYRGERLVRHAGGVNGMVTQTAMLPGRHLGVAVLGNTEDDVTRAIRCAVLDLMIGAPPFDWAEAYDRRRSGEIKDALAKAGSALTQASEGGPSLPLSAYAGLYRDPWYGEVEVVLAEGALSIDFKPTPVFKSALEPWGQDAFRTRFPPLAGEDAVVTFHVQDGRVRHVTMKALSPLADFSYDFQDLSLDRVGGAAVG